MATVTLACTLKAGLILRAQGSDGTPAIVLNGWAQPGFNQGTAGTSFTSGIDADFWAKWSAQNPQPTGGAFPAVYLASTP